MIIYINGIKATREDIEQLNADILRGFVNILNTHRTRRGCLAIVTD